MPAAAPKRQVEKTSRRHRSAPHIWAAETTGLLVVALLILILMLARYWHFLRWSLR